MTDSSITKSGNFLQQAINNVSIYENDLRKISSRDEKLHVPNVANALLFAYEQLRNASENIEDHLLLQRAIHRFYVRNLSFIPGKKASGIGKELIIELTQAEYIENDTITLTAINAIDKLTEEYLALYKKISKSTTEAIAKKWILELLSVKTEHSINNPMKIISFAHFAHAHFSEIIDYDKLIDKNESIAKEDYPTLLYIAIHKALLKSDDANIRASLMELYPKAVTSSNKLIDLNKKYDKLTTLITTANITKFITKNGAPLRIIRSAFLDDNEETNNTVILTKKTQIDNRGNSRPGI